MQLQIGLSKLLKNQHHHSNVNNGY